MLSVLFSNVTLALLPHHSSPTSTSSLLGGLSGTFCCPVLPADPWLGAPPALQCLLLSSLRSASLDGPQLKAVPASGAELLARPRGPVPVQAACSAGPVRGPRVLQTVPPGPPLPGPVRLGDEGWGCTASPGWGVGAPAGLVSLLVSFLGRGTAPFARGSRCHGDRHLWGGPSGLGSQAGGLLRGEQGVGPGWGAWSERSCGGCSSVSTSPWAGGELSCGYGPAGVGTQWCGLGGRQWAPWN